MCNPLESVRSHKWWACLKLAWQCRGAHKLKFSRSVQPLYFMNSGSPQIQKKTISKVGYRLVELYKAVFARKKGGRWRGGALWTMLV